MTEAYDAYDASRGRGGAPRSGVNVARENYRIQEMRYRAGASTILDLLDAQVNWPRPRPIWCRRAT